MLKKVRAFQRHNMTPECTFGLRSVKLSADLACACMSCHLLIKLLRILFFVLIFYFNKNYDCTNNLIIVSHVLVFVSPLVTSYYPADTFDDGDVAASTVDTAQPNHARGRQ